MKITSYNHHVRRLLSFREALVLKPRLPDSIEPSLLSNQSFRVLCERVGTFHRSRRPPAGWQKLSLASYQAKLAIGFSGAAIRCFSRGARWHQPKV